MAGLFSSGDPASPSASTIYSPRLRPRLILVDAGGLLLCSPTLAAKPPCGEGRTRTSIPGRYVLSPFVLAELDYLDRDESAASATELDVLGDVASGAYRLRRLRFRRRRSGDRDHRQVPRLAHRPRRRVDCRAWRSATQTNRVLTLDERHFRALRVGRKRFVVLPQTLKECKSKPLTQPRLRAPRGCVAGTRR